jgi:hypothetical protein
VVVTGKAKGKSPVAGVLVQVNSQSWEPAITTDGWTNWSARVSLEKGANTVRAYAYDSVGDLSFTNVVKVFLHDERIDTNQMR